MSNPVVVDDYDDDYYPHHSHSHSQPIHSGSRNQVPDYSFDFDHFHYDSAPERPTSRRGSPFLRTADSYFDDAFPATPDPQPNFLDTILNPTPIDPHRVRFDHRRQDYDSMPPTRSRAQRPARLSNGYVDLTSDSPSEPASQRRKRQTPSPGPSRIKRQRREDSTPTKRESSTPEAKVEEIDLSDDKAEVQQVLQKQREEAIKAQQKPEEKATTFKTFTCVICMDTPTDLTATACGHLFCHTCLMEALIAGENRTGPNEPKRSQCPVCRKFLSRTKTSDVIPLSLKKGLLTQPRKKAAVSKVS